MKIDDPEATGKSTFAQGSAKGGAQFRRLEGAWWGASTGLLPRDDRRHDDRAARRRRAGVRIQPVRRDHQADLQLAERARLREPRQPHGDAARRSAAVRRQLRRDDQRRRAPAGADAERRHIHVREEQHRARLGLQQRGRPPATTARASGRAPATAPTASGCSSTSRHRASPSPSPAPGREDPSRVLSRRPTGISPVGRLPRSCASSVPPPKSQAIKGVRFAPMAMNNEVLAAHSRRRPGLAPLSADAPALEARGSDRRQVPADRHPDQQLPARGHQAHFRPHAVQLRVAQPPHLADLPHGPVQPGVRRDPRGRTDAGQPPLVPGNGRRGATSGAPFRAPRRRLLSDPCRRSSLPHGLQRDDRGARQPPGRHHHCRATCHDRGRFGDGTLSVRPEGQIVAFEEKPARARLEEIGRSIPAGAAFAEHSADKPFIASMGVYVFSRAALLTMLARDSAKDFGREIIPAALGQFGCRRTFSTATGRMSGPWTRSTRRISC